jgi:hypothetical protein
MSIRLQWCGVAVVAICMALIVGTVIYTDLTEDPAMETIVISKDDDEALLEELTDILQRNDGNWRETARVCKAIAHHKISKMFD